MSIETVSLVNMRNEPWVDIPIDMLRNPQNYELRGQSPVNSNSNISVVPKSGCDGDLLNIDMSTIQRDIGRPGAVITALDSMLGYDSDYLMLPGMELAGLNILNFLSDARAFKDPRDKNNKSKVNPEILKAFINLPAHVPPYSCTMQSSHRLKSDRVSPIQLSSMYPFGYYPPTERVISEYKFVGVWMSIPRTDIPEYFMKIHTDERIDECCSIRRVLQSPYRHAFNLQILYRDAVPIACNIPSQKEAEELLRKMQHSLTIAKAENKRHASPFYQSDRYNDALPPKGQVFLPNSGMYEGSYVFMPKDHKSGLSEPTSLISPYLKLLMDSDKLYYRDYLGSSENPYSDKKEKEIPIRKYATEIGNLMLAIDMETARYGTSLRVGRSEYREKTGLGPQWEQTVCPQYTDHIDILHRHWEYRGNQSLSIMYPWGGPQDFMVSNIWDSSRYVGLNNGEKVYDPAWRVSGFVSQLKTGTEANPNWFKLWTAPVETEKLDIVDAIYLIGKSGTTQFVDSVGRKLNMKSDGIIYIEDITTQSVHPVCLEEEMKRKEKWRGLWL